MSCVDCAPLIDALKSRITHLDAERSDLRQRLVKLCEHQWSDTAPHWCQHCGCVRLEEPKTEATQWEQLELFTGALA